MRLLGWARKARIDTVAHPADEPPQTAAVLFTGRARYGANLKNLRGAPVIPPGWSIMGHALSRDVRAFPELLLEEGGARMPRRMGP